MGVAGMALRVVAILLIAYTAFDIRMHAIRVYGRVIHEFDPWFNFRATQYLADHGWSKFFKWFDYMSWYPLGRPIGTTIYPGMQITSVAIWRLLKATGVASLKMSLNDVCCFVPCWFGVSATLLLGLIAAEAANSANAGIFAAAVMAIVPAHLMRSVGGGYDNESIALTAMCLTFFLWIRSLRNERSWPVGVLTGVAYVYMVAAWGGYIFVLNMIGVHAGLLTLVGLYNSSLYRAYTLFYVIGTYGAMSVPVVGWSPLKSLEQLGPFAVFAFMQVLELSNALVRARKLSPREAFKMRSTVFAVAAAVASVVLAVLWPTGYFGPLSSRVRGLFVKHTRTGNPLVDSVAEHQPASDQAYYQYLQMWSCYLAPAGWAYLLLGVWWHYGKWWLGTRIPADARLAGKTFLLTYGVVGYYFCNKMVRLIILLGPVASALSGVSAGLIFDWAVAHLSLLWQPAEAEAEDENAQRPKSKGAAAAAAGAAKSKKDAGGDKDSAKRTAGSASWWWWSSSSSSSSSSSRKRGSLGKFGTEVRAFYDHPAGRVVRVLIAVNVLWLQLKYYRDFYHTCQSMAEGMSQPSIMFRANLRDGTPVMIDDYREAYWWLRDNTPADSRVMAWWDYGYQIAGIANRTTIADGNTWNHEHIATLGRCLTAPEKHAHRIIRHLADYVLLWTGGGGDDLAKSPHMARIGNSVYDDICPGDPTCRMFGFERGGVPTPMMANSVLYKLHSHNLRPGVQADPSRFQEVYQSKYGKVRIFKVLSVSRESKEWAANPANRVCDAPGSWYCAGRYPPALQWLEKKKKAFRQLEDFNRGGRDEKYYEEYMARMEGRKMTGDGGGVGVERAKGGNGGAKKAVKKMVDEFSAKLKKLIAANAVDEIAHLLANEPELANLRSADGRGPLWWAYEAGKTEVAALLLAAGADPEATDSEGMRPVDLKA